MTDATIEPTQRMADLLTGMAKALADQPDHVRVESESTSDETTLRLFVAPPDLDRVMGKQGRTARSLRTILTAAGKQQHRLNLDIQPES